MTSPRSTRAWDLVGLAARLLLAAVFIGFGWVKAAESPAEMRVAVAAYELVPPGLIDVVAAVLPYLEIAAGLLLLLGLATRIGAALCTLMMIGFLIGIISAAARGLSIDCGCSGGGGVVAAGDTHYTEEILRDVGLLIVSVYLLVRPRSMLSVDGLTRRRGPEADVDEYGDVPNNAAG